MKKVARIIFIAAAFAGLHAQANAGVINFDDNPDGVYFVSPVHSSGFVATSNVNEYGSFPLGTNRAVDGSGPSNGTVHLDSWTNYSSNSAWTLTKQDGGLFSLQSFDFGNGYMYAGAYESVSLLTVTGTKADNSTVSQTFAIDQREFQTLSVSGFTGLTKVRFDAFGDRNRAAFDNIVVDEPKQSDVPEPASLALLGLGLAGAAAARRKSAK